MFKGEGTRVHMDAQRHGGGFDRVGTDSRHLQLLHNQRGDRSQRLHLAVGSGNVGMAGGVVVVNVDARQVGQIKPFGSFTEAIAQLGIDNEQRSDVARIHRSPFNQRILIPMQR